MKGRVSGLIFLCICFLLAVLLATKIILPLTSGSIFAIALVLLGGSSKGFKKK